MENNYKASHTLFTPWRKIPSLLSVIPLCTPMYKYGIKSNAVCCQGEVRAGCSLRERETGPEGDPCAGSATTNGAESLRILTWRTELGADNSNPRHGKW